MEIDLSPDEMLIAITAIKRYFIMENSAEVTMKKLDEGLRSMHRLCPGDPVTDCGNWIYDDPSRNGEQYCGLWRCAKEGRTVQRDFKLPERYKQSSSARNEVNQ